MTHYHDYFWDTCDADHLTDILEMISKCGYKLISVTESVYGYTSHFTLFYDRTPEDKEN